MQNVTSTAVKEGVWAATGGAMFRFLGRLLDSAPKPAPAPEVKPNIAPTAEANAAQETANPRNLVSRQGPDEMSGNKIKKYTKDMKENGFDAEQPIEVVKHDGQTIIKDGHHRTEAAKRAGIPEVPIKTIEVSPEEAERMAREAAEAAHKRELMRR